MANRNHIFAVDEYFHCYNRGTEKRTVFIDNQDFNYFQKSLELYNTDSSLGKLRLYGEPVKRYEIVEMVSYSLLPNHFHLLLKEKAEHGISKFMQRVGVGYTMYFNEKYKHSGGLFQGSYKSKHIETDQDLRQLLAYVTHNNLVHNITDTLLYRSKLNTKSETVRGLTSNLNEAINLKEIVEIIKIQRLSFKE